MSDSDSLPNTPRDGDSKPEEGAEGGGKPATLGEQFKAFAKFGDTSSDGRAITLSQSDKWMKQAHVIDGKKITTTDTAIQFKKFKSQKISFTDYKKFLEDLAKSKSIEVDTIKSKLKECGQPATRATATVKGGAVDRLTDSKKFTGSHKLRFDEEGKGRGIEGRKDVADKSGYVRGYQHKNTYDKAH